MLGTNKHSHTLEQEIHVQALFVYLPEKSQQQVTWRSCGLLRHHHNHRV